ncbi:MAG TPA: 6-phosphogluconolactonase [Candidatus Ozemobacteraceae bacterium]
MVTFRPVPGIDLVVETAPGTPDVIRWFSDRIAEEAASIRARKGRPPLIALSGGSTPGPIYEWLARDHADLVRNAFWCQTDERDVPPDHPDSNQGLIRRTLFQAKPGDEIPTFLAVPLPASDPRVAAQRYAGQLTSHLDRTGADSIDLLLLGIGNDGHTASLFPDADWRCPDDAPPAPPFRAIHVPHLGGFRYTLTLPTLIAAFRRLFLARGESKSSIIYKAIHDEKGVFPAGVVGRQASTLWLLDEAAAANIHR